MDDYLPYLEDVFDFRLSLRDETDRGCALMAAAYLDTELERLLKQHFVADNVSEELLGQNGPLGTFSSRIDLAYAIGLIGKKAHRDLHLIRKIRNEFAHVAKPLSFVEQPIAQRCQEFYYDGLKKGTQPRERFSRVVLGVLAAIHAKIMTTKPVEPREDVVIDDKLQSLHKRLDMSLKEVLGKQGGT